MCIDTHSFFGRLFTPKAFYLCAPEVAATAGWPVPQWPAPEGPGASLTATADLAFRFTDAKVAEEVAALYERWTPPDGKPQKVTVTATTEMRSEPPTLDGQPWW